MEAMKSSKLRRTVLARWLARLGPVVLVVLILLLVLLPVAREQARRASCLSRLGQVAIALQTYAAESGGIYPWRFGASDPPNAWRDLSLLPLHHDMLLCPSARDRVSPRSTEPFLDARAPASDNTIFSYSYSRDHSGSTDKPWTASAPGAVRLLADKKAGVALEKRSNHGRAGRNVLYNDGHAAWEALRRALDPDETDMTIGKPGATAYTDWWSDPPYYGE